MIARSVHRRTVHSARRLTVGVVASLGAVGLLAACSASPAGGGGGGGAAPTELSVLDYFVAEPGHTVYNDLLNRCGEEIGVTIDHESVPGDQLVPKALQLASSRTMPDVLMLNNPDVQQIAATGALAPLSDYDIDTSGLIETIVSAGTYEDEVYGIAPTVNAVALFYNVDLLKAAGVEPPKTWAEVSEIAPKLKNGDVYPIAFAAENTGLAASQFLQAFWSNGGNLNELNSKEGVEALTYWTDLIKNGHASQAVLNFNQDDAAGAFLAGKAAMMVNGPWNIPKLRAATGLNWAVAPVPTRTEDQKVVPSLGGEVWTLPRSTPERQKKAAELLTCLTTEESVMGLAKTAFNVPSLKTAAEKYAEEVPEMAAFVEEVQTARPRTLEVGVRYPAVGAAISDAIQAAGTGSKTAQQAMDDAQAQAEQAK